MRPCMYLLSNPSDAMSTGKRAAQVAHAAVEAFRLEPRTSSDANVKRMWDCGGHYMKVVLATDDLWNAKHYIEERGFQTVLIMDEGHTEFDADLTPTALGVEILDKDAAHVRETFGAFKLYADPKPSFDWDEWQAEHRHALEQVLPPGRPNVEPLTLTEREVQEESEAAFQALANDMRPSYGGWLGRLFNRN